MPRKKLWGGRFTADSDPVFAAFNDSLSFDRELLEADVAGSLAYAQALERAGIFTPSERKKVQDGLRAVLEEHRSNPGSILQSSLEDVHSYVEKALQDRIGPLALRLHTGRSRNDQVATDLRLFARSTARRQEELLNALLVTLADLAEAHPKAIVPGYTHLQRAQPVLFSHYLLAYGEMFLRDRDRLRSACSAAGLCPLGAGALSGTAYSVDRRRLARDLGFSGITANSMDAVADRDFVLDYLYFAAMLMMHLSRLSEDLILYTTTEFAFLQMHDSVSSGSSLMPQKKNPDALELIRGKTGRVYGSLVGMLTVLKSLPMTYNKDLQEDKEGLFDAVRTVTACVRMMRLVLDRVEVREQSMLAATVDGFLNATELADYLVDKGMPFRTAHDLAGRIVLRASQLALPLEALPLEEYRTFSPVFSCDLYPRLRMERIVAARKEPGGTAPSQVRRALRAFRKRILLRENPGAGTGRHSA